MNEWKIDVGHLVGALRVLELVPVRSGVASSVFVKILGGKEKGSVIFRVAAETAGEIRLKGRGNWPASFPVYIDRRMFVPFVFAGRSTKASFIFLMSSKGELEVRQGRRRAVFVGQKKVSGYSSPPTSKGSSRLHLSGSLSELSLAARDCASNDPVTPQLNCVYLEPKGKVVEVLATNQKILYMAGADGKLQTRWPVPFPLFLVQLLGADDLRGAYWKQRYIVLRFASGRIWQAVSSKAQKGFPVRSIRKYLSSCTEEKLLFSVDSVKFSRVVVRLSGYLEAVRRQDWALLLWGKKGDSRLHLKSTVPQSVFTEQVLLKKPLMEDVKLWWPFEMMLPVLTFLGKCSAPLDVRRNRNGVSFLICGSVRLAVPPRAKR